MPDIFISYNRHDRHVARGVADALVARGQTLWWDAALDSVDDFDSVVERALKSAKVVVVLCLLKMVMANAVLKDGPFMNMPLQLMYDYLTRNYPSDPTTGPMRYIIPCDRLAPLPCAMAEWSFDPANLPKVMHVCKTYFDANKWPNLSVEIECTRTDTYLMSAWNWPNLPYIVKLNFQYLTAFLDDGGKAEIMAHLQGLWDALTTAGIPFKAHWGKINFNTPPVVAKNYGLAAFLPHVKPMFMNDYLRERFGH